MEGEMDSMEGEMDSMEGEVDSMEGEVKWWSGQYDGEMESMEGGIKWWNEQTELKTCDFVFMHTLMRNGIWWYYLFQVELIEDICHWEFDDCWNAIDLHCVFVLIL